MFRKTIAAIGLGIAAAAAQPALAGDDEVIGALIGAGVGAAIGHNVDGERGAVLGGAIGAVTGASIAGADRGYRHVHYEESHGYYTPAQPVYRRPAPVLVERIEYAPPQRHHWRRHWHERHRHDDDCDHGGRWRHRHEHHWR